MELLERYELILNQALKELGPVDLPREKAKADQVRSVLAPVLADVVYRLCIEHGVAFTPFRESVLAMLSGAKPALAPKGPPSSQPRSFGAAFESAHPLLIRSLELMPPDEPF